MNKVILIGRLTKDPELRKTPTDVSVVQFSLAVNRNYSNRNGERQADFINCIAWRNQAENLARYIKKGGQIAVEGSIQTRSYDDNNGVRRNVVEVLCEQIHFIEPKRQDGGYGDLSQLEVPPLRESRQTSYANDYSSHGNVSPVKQSREQSVPDENPFEDIKNNFDISDDDLPF